MAGVNIKAPASCYAPLAEALGRSTDAPNPPGLYAKLEVPSVAVQAVAQSNDEGTSEHGSNAAANAGAAAAEGQTAGSSQTATPVLVIQASARK